MTCHAIHRRILLSVASDAKSHRVIHLSLCDRLLPHIAMTDRTIHAGPDMRRVIEHHVCRWRKAIHALPRHGLAPCAVCSKLLNLRVVPGDYLMAVHAEIDVRDSSVGTLVDADVTVGALHAVTQVHFMRVGNGLDGLRAEVKKIPNGIGNGGMRRGENIRGLPLERSFGYLGRQNPSTNYPCQHNHADCNCDAGTRAQTKRRPKNTPSSRKKSPLGLDILPLPTSPVKKRSVIYLSFVCLVPMTKSVWSWVASGLGHTPK
jgi:hypothetical protein